MGLSRRRFITVGGMGLLVAACAPGRLATGDVGTSRTALPLDFDPGDEPLFINIFLRGGADGLHLLPPTGDRGYARLRGSLALSETLAFDRDFSLHPELAPLGPLVERGQLAAVPAAGSSDPTRSHFEAQDIMELGGQGGASLGTGWLTRAFGADPTQHSFARLAITSATPLSLRGSGAFAIGDPDHFGLPRISRRARAAIEAAYASGSDPVSRSGARALSALTKYEVAMAPTVSAGRRGRRTGRDLAERAAQLLRLDRAGLGVRAAFLESDDWDTHAGQGSEEGKMAARIADLGRAIATLDEGLGPRRDWLVVVMTEFGRTVKPNGSRGTDHGHGSTMFAAGPRVRGGIYGDWAGLSEGKLYEGRDLPVLTDWRSVLAELLTAQLGTALPKDSFPDFEAQTLGMV